MNFNKKIKLFIYFFLSIFLLFSLNFIFYYKNKKSNHKKFFHTFISLEKKIILNIHFAKSISKKKYNYKSIIKKINQLAKNPTLYKNNLLVFKTAYLFFHINEKNKAIKILNLIKKPKKLKLIFLYLFNKKKSYTKKYSFSIIKKHFTDKWYLKHLRYLYYLKIKNINFSKKIKKENEYQFNLWKYRYKIIQYTYTILIFLGIIAFIVIIQKIDTHNSLKINFFSKLNNSENLQLTIYILILFWIIINFFAIYFNSKLFQLIIYFFKILKIKEKILLETINFFTNHFLTLILSVILISKVFIKKLSIKNFFIIKRFFNLKTIKKSFYYGILSFLSIIPLMSLFELFYFIIFKNTSLNNQTLFSLILSQNNNLSISLIFITSCIIVPLKEELFFRACLMPLLQIKYGIFIGIIFSALLFSIVHFNLYSFIPISFLGFLLGITYQKSKNLLSSIIAHSLWNMFILIKTIYIYSF